MLPLAMIPPDYSCLKNFIHSKIDPNEKFIIPLISEDKVTKLLANLEENKATGLDEVSTKLLQLSAPVLYKTITRLLNLSIDTGSFPSTWKIGKVSPIHKSDNRSE